MTLSKQAVIDRTIQAINLLPADKAEEISDFADFVSKLYEEQQLAQGIQKLAAESQAFAFLYEEEELYTVADLQAVYIDPSLDKYDNVVLFPEKLAKANALLNKAGPPKFPEPKKQLL